MSFNTESEFGSFVLSDNISQVKNEERHFKEITLIMKYCYAF